MSSKGMVSVAVVFMTMGGVLFLATPAARASVLYWYYTDGGCWEPTFIGPPTPVATGHDMDARRRRQLLCPQQ